MANIVTGRLSIKIDFSSGDKKAPSHRLRLVSNSVWRNLKPWCEFPSRMLVPVQGLVPATSTRTRQNVLYYSYEDSPRGAASAGTTCLFLGWLLMSLLSFYHVQLGWNFNMLVSELAGVNWPEKLTIYGHGTDLWHKHIKILANLHKKKAQERCLKYEKVTSREARCGSSGRLLICRIIECLYLYLH